MNLTVEALHKRFAQHKVCTHHHGSVWREFIKFFNNLSDSQRLIRILVLDNFSDIEKQIAGSVFPIDVLKWQGGYALNMFNIGVDCDVVAEAAAMKSDRLKGTAAYLAAAFKVLRRGKTYRMAYAVEDGEEQHGEYAHPEVGRQQLVP